MPRKRSASYLSESHHHKRKKYNQNDNPHRITLDQLSIDIFTHLGQFIQVKDYLALLCTNQSLAFMISKSISHLHADHLQAYHCIYNMPHLKAITCNTWWDFISHLPRQLTYLHIQEVRCRIDISTVYVPSGLTYLHLGLRDSYMSDALLDQLPSTLTHLQLNTPPIVLNAIQLNQLPPSLTHLGLPSCKSILQDTQVTFPSGLITLNMERLLTVSIIWMKQLPVTLECLKLFCQDHLDNDDVLQYLPPHLTFLHMGLNQTLTSDHLLNLPRSLRVFQLPYARLKHVASLQALPLTEINVFDIVDDQMNPLSVRDFSCPSFSLTILRSMINLKEGDIALLPRTLTHLTCRSALSCDFVHLPTSLTFLKLNWYNNSWNDGCDDYDAHFHQLPRQLLHLNIIYSRFISYFDLVHLPPNLTYLKLDMHEDMTLESVKLLPRTLKTLILKSNISFDNKAINYLPPHLTCLKLNANPNLTLRGVRALPQSLTSLHVGNCKKLKDNCVAALPRQLEKLWLPCHYYFTTACVPHLPLRLKQLQFYTPYLSLGGWMDVDVCETNDGHVSLVSKYQ